MNQFNFKIGDERLAVIQVGERPEILVLHGAGSANMGRALPLISNIVEVTGKGALSFDFSGHGKSTGQLKNSSLKKRTEEARCVAKYLAGNGQT